jgi:hypothetical protein
MIEAGTRVIQCKPGSTRGEQLSPAAGRGREGLPRVSEGHGHMTVTPKL